MNCQVILQNTFITCEPETDSKLHTKRRSNSAAPCVGRIVGKPLLSEGIELKKQLERLTDHANSRKPHMEDHKPKLHQQRVGNCEHLLNCPSTASMKGAAILSTGDGSATARSIDSLDIFGSSSTECSSPVDEVYVQKPPIALLSSVPPNVPLQRTNAAPLSSAQLMLFKVQMLIPAMTTLADLSHGVQSGDQDSMVLPQQSSMKVAGRSSCSEVLEIKQGCTDRFLTTAMLRNIPFLYSEMELASEIDELGFKGKYDLLYLPKHKKENMGYAFVNMKTPELYEEFAKSFYKYVFKCHRDKYQKKASVSVAACQGYRANVERITKARNKAGLLI